MSNSPGVVLIVLGLVLVAVGMLIWSGGLSWFGHLPGDIRLERGSLRVYLPITSMLILSLVLSLLGYTVRRLL